MKTINEFLLEQRFSIPKRTLSGIGKVVTILGMGGDGFFHEEKNNDKVLPIIQQAVDDGINYFDTARSYGFSESHLGKVLPSVRDKVYVATKTTVRSYDGAARELEISLKALNMDFVDCYQIHAIKDINDIEKILAKDGALKFFEKAKDQGLIKHIGITGHNAWAMRELLEKYDGVESVLALVNAADKHLATNSTIDTLIPTCKKKNITVIAMKVLSSGKMPRYLTPCRALNYVWSISGIQCAVIGMSSLKELEENLACVRKFKKLSAVQMKACEVATKGSWEVLSEPKIN